MYNLILKYRKCLISRKYRKAAILAEKIEMEISRTEPWELKERYSALFTWASI